MPIKCKVMFESTYALYTIKSLCYNTYKAFLRKGKNKPRHMLPATLTITKNGLHWEGNSSHSSIIQELATAIEYRINNDLYERLY